jgi:hypothetical protein
LADILRPFCKTHPFSDEQRKEMYGVDKNEFCIVNDIRDSDIVVLPMSWNFYLKSGRFSEAAKLIQQGRDNGRPVLSYINGDQGIKLPPGFPDVFTVRPSGFRSRRAERQFTQPSFFDDPFLKYSETQTPQQDRKEADTPSVGFCGQSSANVFQVGGHVMQTLLRNAAFHCRLKLEEPQPLYPAALLRAKAMKILAASPKVRTCFIARERYHGGSADADTRERTTREFYLNMAQTDYTLCVRGGGNFSKRFYETLAMGRIPLLVDTDCLLPFELELNWDDYIVRVSQAELATLPEVAARHYAAHGFGGMAELKRRCRLLWEEWLSFAGFHRQLAWLILDRAGTMKGGKMGGTIPAGRFD